MVIDLDAVNLDNLYRGTTAGETLTGTPGNDLLFGLRGNDTLNGGDGYDKLDGGLGTDTINGGAGIDMVFGSEGNDTIIYDANDAFIDGGIGNDTLDASATTTGIVFNPAAHHVESVIGGNGNDQIDGSASSSAELMLAGLAGMDAIAGEVISAAEAASTALSLFGGLGEDTLIGGGGSDFLDGGPDNDSVNGGAGADTAVFTGDRAAYAITRGGVTTTIVGPDGTDTVTSVERFQFDDIAVAIRSAANDFNGDGRSDVLFSNLGAVYASNYEWQINNRSLVSEGRLGAALMVALCPAVRETILHTARLHYRSSGNDKATVALSAILPRQKYRGTMSASRRA
jgi:Ca2+-binding RTX toxin-like protein